MTGSDGGFVLVVRVWHHDGVPVARLLAQPPVGPPSESEPTVAGVEAISEAIIDWVRSLPPTAGLPPRAGPPSDQA